MRRRPKVTRQMFIEEYTRQLLKLDPDIRTDMNRLGRVLAYAIEILDGKADSYRWYYWEEPIARACYVLGISSRIKILRKLLKE